MMEGQTLLEQTIELLRLRQSTFREIAAATGLDYDWLSKLSQGAIGDPGVRKIEKLHAYLSAERAA